MNSVQIHAEYVKQLNELYDRTQRVLKAIDDHMVNHDSRLWETLKWYVEMEEMSVAFQLLQIEDPEYYAKHML